MRNLVIRLLLLVEPVRIVYGGSIRSRFEPPRVEQFEIFGRQTKLPLRGSGLQLDIGTELIGHLSDPFMVL